MRTRRSTCRGRATAMRLTEGGDEAEEEEIEAEAEDGAEATGEAEARMKAGR